MAKHARPSSRAKSPARTPKATATGGSGSERVGRRIEKVGGWRGDTLARLRALILEADPEMVEDCKWAKATNPLGVPVWSHDGIVCTGETYAAYVKLTFAYGAVLPDPSHLFNAGLKGGTRRAIDIHEGETIDAAAFRALVKAAVAENRGDAKTRQPRRPTAAR